MRASGPTEWEKRMLCIVGSDPNQIDPKRQGTREARGGKEGKREFDRCERQRAEDAAAPSSCPRRTNLGHGLNVRPGSGSADPGIFGYFPSMESTSPGGEISPVLLRKSGPRDGQKANFKRRAELSRPTAGRPYDPRTLHGVGNESIRISAFTPRSQPRSSPGTLFRPPGPLIYLPRSR